MNKKAILLSVILFLLGLFIGSLYTLYIEKNKVRSFELSSENSQYVTATVKDFNFNNSKKFEELEKLNESQQEIKDKPSPSNWIKKEQIFVYDDEVVIKIKNPQWAIFTDSKSMDPVIDSTSKAIEIVPKSEQAIHVGDIVAYQSRYKEGIVAHRVVEIAHDAFGWYAILKGDNNDSIDPGKVRFEQIKRIVVAVIY